MTAATAHRRRRSRPSVASRGQISDVDHRESKQRRRQGAYERRQDRQDSRSRQNGERRQDRNRDRLEHQDRSHDRRQRRGHEREPMVPKTSMEELSKLKVAELREKAAELELDVTGLKKAELVAKVFEASVRAEGFIEVEGVLDTMPDGYGFLRTKGYLPSENDVYVGLSTIRRNGLRKGDYVKGQTRPARPNEKYAALQQVSLVNGDSVENQGVRVKFGDLTPVFPDECLSMEHGKNTITARVIDLVSPIGKGQRGLIVSPPKAGKTTVLKDIAAAITANNPEVHLMCLLVDERPEEVTDMQRSIKGEVIASTFDMPTENHIAVSELVIERAKRLVERGEDVVILLDSLTRLARAYNLAQPASGRILSGGVDSTALYPPKRFLGAARNIEGGGSLTILASALIDTGSKMDEVIFEEFKGTGNMELKLDRSLAERRVFPAIDPVASGTRREELLLDPQEAPLVWAVRRILSNMN
ncbi:MAG: transcription termination factor Rho, partial [Slackia sp.]